MAAFSNTAEGEASNEPPTLQAAVGSLGQETLGQFASQLPDTGAWVLEQAAQKKLADQAAEAARLAQIAQEAAWQQEQATLSSSQSSASYASSGSGSCGSGLLANIASMESGCSDVPNSGGSGATGVLQFMPGTFAGVCGTCCDIHSTACQLQAGQAMIDQGRQCEWAVLNC